MEITAMDSDDKKLKIDIDVLRDEEPEGYFKKPEIKPEMKPSSSVTSMTKEEAIKYLGLPADANDYAIDEKFWKLSKRYRGMAPDYRNEEGLSSEQLLTDLSAAYDIATGACEARQKALEVRASEKKFFRKTAGEWKNYFGYTWLKWLVVIAISICVINIGYHAVFKKGYDTGIISIGHFYADTSVVESYLTTNLGYTNPYINAVDLVVLNDQDQVTDVYAEETASTLFLSVPDVIVTDDATLKYYYDECVDLSDFYEELRATLPAEVFGKITPIYCSESEYHKLTADYLEAMNMDSDPDDENATYSETSVLIGLEINDPDVINALGYENKWPSYEPSLVFSIYTGCNSQDNAKKIITSILSDWGNYTA